MYYRYGIGINNYRPHRLARRYTGEDWDETSWPLAAASVALVSATTTSRIRGADRATGQKYTDAVIRIALTLNSLDLRGFMNWMDHHRRVFSRNVLKWELVFLVDVRKKSKKKIIRMYTYILFLESKSTPNNVIIFAKSQWCRCQRRHYSIMQIMFCSIWRISTLKKLILCPPFVYFLHSKN